MTFRADVSVDWTVSPRIITVASPSTEITIQDLFDTCKVLEAQLENLDSPILILAAGKEALGGGTFVGITATLQNALLAFEARPGPSYTQCSVSGGNLVALQSDLVTYYATPIEPTAFTQIVTTASSSATTQSQAQLEHSTFEGGVWVDQFNSTGNATSGTAFPVGTSSTPVDNFVDANTIAHARGFVTMYIMGNATLDSGDDVSGHMLIGQNAARSQITINSAAETIGCEIRDAYVTGNLDGGTIIRNSVIHNLNYVNGFVHNTTLESNTTIYLGGANTAHFLQCFSGTPGTGTAIVDCNGVTNDQTTPLAFRGYNGGIQLNELNSGANVSVDFVSGQLKIDHTCTSGTIVVRGAASVWYNTSGAPTTWTHANSGTYNGGLTLINEATSGNHVHDMWSHMGLDPDNQPGTFTNDTIAAAVYALVGGGGGGGGLTVLQAQQLEELWKRQGFDETAPVTLTPNSITFGTTTIQITGDGTNTSTLTRQP